jgi:hypothetical protein
VSSKGILKHLIKLVQPISLKPLVIIAIKRHGATSSHLIPLGMAGLEAVEIYSVLDLITTSFTIRMEALWESPVRYWQTTL